ncbi:two pore calcium channel protein 1-like protein [Dinothrombium tinctorium]|uniref:Two pore calcium channel protein 1-like protein n=1 Tax=Dinothrombium tinctorium TaxID=1965070 RepID=A0A3S3Q4H4_9ACAR|nr:two pore calcium channel protein 1-like protein [Dinothrombium tinctorium]
MNESASIDRHFSLNVHDEDIPNEFSSSYSSTWQRTSSFNIDHLLLGVDNETDEVKKTWNMNYKEASIYLEEGYNNDKFDHHPRSRDALPAYLIVHNRYFYMLDLIASLVLLALAFFERPAVPGFELSPGIHASLELLALSVVSVELFMKLRWMKLKPFLSHTRTVIKLITLIIMIIEALVVLIRLYPHFRVTRALRPVFLIDNYYCGGIRRVIRQILQSLPPIIDMLLLLFFFMLIFSLVGFYLFSSNPNDSYFSSLERSFISLFVLLTTANYPDVMMPSYYRNSWSALFFIAFLVIHLYFLMNLMLAVVYEAFTRMERIKFKKLLLHRRSACHHAFRLLVTRNNPTQMSFKHFAGLMNFYKPNATKKEIYLMFKALDVNKSMTLTLDEFFNVYEIAELKWVQKHDNYFWFSNSKFLFIRRICEMIKELVSNKWFDIAVNITIGFSIFWQRFGSVSVVVLIVYYFFAIVGMEIFSGVNLKNCCANTSVAQYFSPSQNGYYFINNFDNVARSYVTLFELMVVNNWYVLMDGYAYKTSEWSRLYFMFFYIITLIVITVVVAFVLDAFLFRIQYARKMGGIEGKNHSSNAKSFIHSLN